MLIKQQFACVVKTSRTTRQSIHAATSAPHVVGSKPAAGNGHFRCSPIRAVWQRPAHPQGHHEAALALQAGSADCAGDDDWGLCPDGFLGVLLFWQ